MREMKRADSLLKQKSSLDDMSIELIVALITVAYI